MKRAETGVRGEHLAAGFLRGRGYVILDTGFRCRSGEIDIVARDGDCLVFVEVRTKTGRGFGSPEESVTAKKKERLRATAAHYCQTHTGLPSSIRIDFVAVELDRRGNPARIELVQNAVGETDT